MKHKHYMSISQICSCRSRAVHEPLEPNDSFLQFSDTFVHMTPFLMHALHDPVPFKLNPPLPSENTPRPPVEIPSNYSLLQALTLNLFKLFKVPNAECTTLRPVRVSNNPIIVSSSN